MTDRTKVMHLPPGAPPERPSLTRRQVRWPYAKTIVTLFMANVVLWTITINFYLQFWKDITW